MKRRDFLKGSVGVVAGTVIIPTVIKANPEYSCSASASVNPSAAPSVEPEYPNKYACEDYHNCTERDCFTCESLWVDSRRILRTEVYVDHNFIVSFDRQLTDYEANAIMDENVNANVSFVEFGWRKY